MEDSTDASDLIPRPDGSVPISLDSDGPEQEFSPSDESWAELNDRTCGNNESGNGGGGRTKRSRPPDFIPGKRLKQDALRLSFVGNKERIKPHCIHNLAAIDGAQTLAGLESALTAWVAAQCDRPPGQELSPDDETRFAKEAGEAKNRELDAWCKFKVFSPVLWKHVAKDIVDTRQVLTWKDVEEGRTVKARLVARGFQDPDLAAGLADTSSCVSLRSSHLQVTSLSALKRWKLSNLDI